MTEGSDIAATATRAHALAALSRFVPCAGRDYAAQRNFDRGPGRHTHVSGLSAYLRHRVITEKEVLHAVLARHSRASAEKFVQEVFWRTYWKGWLEQRPSVWASYQADLRRALDAVHSQSGLRSAWEEACMGRTGLACFDAWAQELVQTGYLHNHARMWCASIWIFTLRLPWVLGADFFLRHLLDGDPASNTLSWRWVAGLQTRGKHYVARAANIAKYTEERFHPEAGALAAAPLPLDGPPHPDRLPAPEAAGFDPSRPSVLLLHDDDLAPAWLFDDGMAPQGTAILDTAILDTAFLGTAIAPPPEMSPLHMAPKVTQFRTAAMADCVTRWQGRMGKISHDVDDVIGWARDLGAEQIVTPYAPVGPHAEALALLSGLKVVRVLRPYDARAWPCATAGFFKFKAQIPRLIDSLQRDPKTP